MNIAVFYNLRIILKKYRLLFLALGGVMLYFGVISPFITKWQNVKNEIRILEKKFNKTLSLLEDEKRINAIYNALAKVMEIKSAKKIDIDEEITNTYNFLLQNANRLGVRIMNFRPHKPQRKKSKEYKEIKMDLDIEAPILEFIRYVYYLENSAQLIEIESASLRPGSDGLYIRVRLKKILF